MAERTEPSQGSPPKQCHGVEPSGTSSCPWPMPPRSSRFQRGQGAEPPCGSRDPAAFRSRVRRGLRTPVQAGWERLHSTFLLYI